MTVTAGDAEAIVTSDQAINELSRKADERATALLMTCTALHETLTHITALEDEAGNELGRIRAERHDAASTR